MTNRKEPLFKDFNLGHIMPIMQISISSLENKTLKSFTFIFINNLAAERWNNLSLKQQKSTNKKKFIINNFSKELCRMLEYEFDFFPEKYKVKKTKAKKRGKKK